MNRDVVLTVSEVSDHGDCAVCQMLAENHKVDGSVLVNLKLEGEFTGKLKIEIPVTRVLAAREGQQIVVLLCRDGKVWAVRAKVIKGRVVFETDEVGVFLILGDSTKVEETEDGTHMILDGEMIPFGGWL